MADQFVGTWNMQSSEHFDEYMKAVGVGTVLASLASTAKPTLIITVSGDAWTLKSETTFKTSKVEFKIGEEFDETTADDRKMRTTFTIDGNKLIQDQKTRPDKKDVPSVIVREVNGDKMTVTCTAKTKDGDVAAIRHYTKA